jgi:hypothetical protein
MLPSMIGIEIVCFVKKMTFCAALSEPPIEITGRVPGQAGGGAAPAALGRDRSTDGAASVSASVDRDSTAPRTWAGREDACPCQCIGSAWVIRRG